MKLGEVAIFGALTVAIGCAAAPPRPKATPPAIAAAPPAPSPGELLVPEGPPVERVSVALGGPARGPSTAKVTIVEFSDFQCPFCARANATLDQLLRDYPNDLRILFRHNPLPFHAHARPAAEAAVVAEGQGKFWEMHDKLFAAQGNLARPELERHAVELGLDLTAFRAALDTHAGKARVDADLALGRQLGVRGTPSFFINGRPLLGAQEIDAFKLIIDDEIVRADSLLRRGLPRDRLYATLMTGARPTMGNGAGPTVGKTVFRVPTPPARPQPDTDAGVRIRVDVAGAPVRGPADAPITIVEWSDFQCPFCARVEETLTRLRQEHPDKIRFVWRDMPLPFHEQARPAAIAARAAGAQGKFWAMHDRLYAEQGAALGRQRFEKDAAELGLDGRRFRAALDAEAGKSGIDADLLAGAKAGVAGTPTFFINGKVLNGAQPYETFEARIADELKVTDAMIAKGTPRAQLYAALMKEALPVRPPAKPSKDDDDPVPEADDKIYPVKPGDGPSKGPANAPLVLVVFSDFQCPFCKRVEPTLAEMEKHYAGKLRVVWKNFPLPFHANAEPAAEAAMAADAQGKFWPMHDRLFENNTALDRDSLENYAAAIGLDLPRFRADLDAGRYKARIDADMQEGTDLGVLGTPAVFINGRKIAGAFPFATFQQLADAELDKVTAQPPGKPTGGTKSAAKPTKAAR